MEVSMDRFIVTLLKGLGVLLAIAILIALGFGLLYLGFLFLGVILEVIFAILPFVGIALAVAIPVGIVWLVGKAVSKKSD